MTKRRSALPSLGLTAALLAGSAGAHAAEGDVDNATCQSGAAWLFNAFYPVKTPQTPNLQRAPRSTVFVPWWQRGSMGQRRIVMFGDLHGMDKDTPPAVGSALRNLFNSADLVVGNIETNFVQRDTLDLGSSQQLQFKSSTAYLKSAMNEYCIDPQKAVLSIANNHSGDRDVWNGNVPLWNQTKLAQANLGVRGIVGLDENAAASDPEIKSFDVGGLRVGVVAWTHVQNKPPEQLGGSDVYPTWEVSKRVTGKSFQQRKVDGQIELLIGMPHWDCQFYWYPQQKTVDFMEGLQQSGFDVIAGSHPSVLQPGRIFQGDPDNAVGFYSLGAINSAINFQSSDYLVPVLELIVNDAGKVLQYTVHPFVMHHVPVLGARIQGYHYCGTRVVTDKARDTEWTVMPLADLAYVSPSDYARLKEHLDTVFPVSP